MYITSAFTTYVYILYVTAVPGYSRSRLLSWRRLLIFGITAPILGVWVNPTCTYGQGVNEKSGAGASAGVCLLPWG